ncbi:MAG: hypothetical protein DRO14_00385 [Thermoprotei archaeon]|nr:MAG: hypothetical protein DRO14_00050 [Thermoprotei archaeon]RLG78606.1 MAG: hypothetical protein DRO14_00385 [Thermoprotei archaeon]
MVLAIGIKRIRYLGDVLEKEMNELEDIISSCDSICARYHDSEFCKSACTEVYELFNKYKDAVWGFVGSLESGDVWKMMMTDSYRYIDYGNFLRDILKDISLGYYNEANPLITGVFRHVKGFMRLYEFKKKWDEWMWFGEKHLKEYGLEKYLKEGIDDEV